jgi:hypothetical protein
MPPLVSNCRRASRRAASRNATNRGAPCRALPSPRCVSTGLPLRVSGAIDLAPRTGGMDGQRSGTLRHRRPMQRARWSASMRWWRAQGRFHGYVAMHSTPPVSSTGGDRRSWRPIRPGTMQPAGACSVSLNAVVDGDDTHRLSHSAGVDELLPDAASSAAPTACASALPVHPVENSRTGKMLRPMRTEPRQCHTSPRFR